MEKEVTLAEGLGEEGGGAGNLNETSRASRLHVIPRSRAKAIEGAKKLLNRKH